MKKLYAPEGFSAEIFKNRYAFTPDESWEDACARIAKQMALAETPDKQKRYEENFYNTLASNQFVPGGRIWYNSGRVNPQLLNCFVLDPKKDSKEGWGNTAKNMIITSMTGGGCGDDFSDVRPRGASIFGQKGEAPGAVELMRLEDACANPVRSGGQRRVALMFSLDLDHPDIEEFLDSKLEKGQLTNANISVRSKNTAAFIKAVKNDLDWELSWKGKYKRNVKAKDLWNKIVTNAYNSAEPGFLNWEMVEKESNIYYVEELVSTNPCFHGETLITTDSGLHPIKDLVGKTVNVFSGGKKVQVDNFRVTAENQQILQLTLQDGSNIKVTPYHKMILANGDRVEAKALKVGEKLLISSVETHGQISTNGAYIKGFLTGDGTTVYDRPQLNLYSTKYMCENRLIASAREIPNKAVNTNALEDLMFTEERDSRKRMTGLAPKKHELYKWARDNKKRLPTEIYQWDFKSKSNFIAGVMDADGNSSSNVNGFMYQISSIHKGWLEDFQMLLKTMGVRSKIALNKVAATKDFNDGYGPYESKALYRLTISQTSSVKLASQVEFTRLKSFKDETPKHNVNARFNTIVKIEELGVEDKVYCCTVPDTHSITLAVGIEVGQCGEIALSAFDCCCLGHLVLPRFVENGDIDYAALANTIRTSVRFLDNVLTVNSYPLPEMRDKSHKLRRIGLGTTGLADTLALLGLRYGSEEGNKLVEKLYRFISKVAYESSVMLAIEKGAFPACEPDKHIESGFMKRMPSKIKALVREHGIRNCAILTQAPTGTVSILSGNCSSGIEPIFAPAYERRYWVKEERKTELVFHPLFAKFMEEGKPVDQFVFARDLTARDHMEVQRIVQKHVDNAVSKTINLPEDYPIEDMAALWLEYLPQLKGTTFYRENTRGYVDEKGVVHEPPLKALTLEEARERFDQNAKREGTEDCISGVCGI